MEAFEVAFEATVPLGQRLDLVFAIMRVAFLWSDRPLVRSSIARAHKLLEEGGDWDRRNRLKVYEGLFSLSVRDFAKSAELLLSSVATFTTYELFSYAQFINYTVLVAIIALDRPALKEKVIQAPEVLAVIHGNPSLAALLNSIYECKYATFFQALATITDEIKKDVFFAPHAKFICRELRVMAYRQYLESYLSVTMNAMASAFGVTDDFIDREVSRFIASDRLNCKIDKVAETIVTTRADKKNTQYQATLAEGDLLLHRVQKLSRVISH